MPANEVKSSYKHADPCRVGFSRRNISRRNKTTKNKTPNQTITRRVGFSRRNISRQKYKNTNKHQMHKVSPKIRIKNIIFYNG